MSMPVIEPSKTTRCQAITDIIESVALQQTGLSHILNAEGEKIQAGIKFSESDPNLLLDVNKSVQSMINSITRLEVILQGKLELFKDCICETCEETKEELAVSFEVSDNGGSIVKTDTEDIYLYTPGTLRANIKIVTENNTPVSEVSKLPEGWTLVDNLLVTPFEADWSVQQLVKLRVGTEGQEGSFEFTIVNAIV